MSKRAMLVLMGIWLLAISAAELKGITWGQPDGNGHPHVGTLLFLRPGGFFSCTGTLLSPTVMVTAGHCTEEAGQVNLGTWVSFDPVITFEGIEKYKTVIQYLDARWNAAQAIPHPLFDDFNAFPNTSMWVC